MNKWPGWKQKRHVCSETDYRVKLPYSGAYLNAITVFDKGITLSHATGAFEKPLISNASTITYTKSIIMFWEGFFFAFSSIQSSPVVHESVLLTGLQTMIFTWGQPPRQVHIVPYVHVPLDLANRGFRWDSVLDVFFSFLMYMYISRQQSFSKQK